MKVNSKDAVNKAEVSNKEDTENKGVWLNNPTRIEGQTAYALGWKSPATAKISDFAKKGCDPVCLCNTGGYCMCVSDKPPPPPQCKCIHYSDNK